MTVVASKSKRLTFFEVPQDLCSMLDMAKVADLILLVINGSFGFEMETFEFLNMLQTHGFPKVTMWGGGGWGRVKVRVRPTASPR